MSLSNFWHFSQLVLSTHPLLLYQLLSSFQTFVALSNFCHLLIFYVIYAPYKCTDTRHQTAHKFLSRLIERTPSAPIPLSQLNRCFGHRAILMQGGRGMAGGFYPCTNSYIIAFLLFDVVIAYFEADSSSSHPVIVFNDGVNHFNRRKTPRPLRRSTVPPLQKGTADQTRQTCNYTTEYIPNTPLHLSRL